MSRIIDFETHLQTSACINEIEEFNGYPRYRTDEKGRFTWYASSTMYEVRHNLEDKLASPETRIRDMDKAGIRMQVLASPNPGPEVFPSEMGIRLARINNDAVAEYARKYPERFVGLASLPMQEIDAAIAELDRVNGLGLSGLLVFSNVRGKPVNIPEFWSIYARAEKYRMPIFIHPTVPANPEMYADYGMWGPVMGFGVDAMRAALRVIMSGLLEEHAGLRIVLGHLGETIPFFLRGIDFVYLRTLEKLPTLKKKPSEYFLSNFYVDTSGIFNEPSLMCVYDTLSHDRILFGSDYPFEDSQKGVDFLSRSRIPDGDKERIYWTNAAELLSLRST